MQASRKKRRSEGASVRFGQRVPLDVHVRLRAGNRVEGNGTIRNASVSGAFIVTGLELPLYTELAVTLSIPGEAPAAHVLEARVVRLDATGLGIEWRDTGATDIIDLLARAS